MFIVKLTRQALQRQPTLKISAVLLVAAALIFLGYLSSQDVPIGSAAGGEASPLKPDEIVKLLAQGNDSEKRKINASLPTVETVAASPQLATKLAQTIQNCRHWRIQDHLSGLQPGQQPFVAMGMATTCKELFDRYGDRLDQALHHLKSSTDPVLRGYYYDANYDILSGRALAFQGTLPSDSPVRQAFEKLADAHFVDVARDIDHCSADSVARMHLSQKLTSPQFANSAVSYFASRVLMAHDPADVNLRAYSDRVREDAAIDRQLAAQIEASVLRATAKGCGIGHLGTELAFWKGYGGGKVTQLWGDDLDTRPSPTPR